jgi:hypothetical protein
MAGWLYRVAYRAALRAREAAARRPTPLPDGAEVAAPGEPDGGEARELHEVLDDELSKLPDKYRTLILLCYFQGKTHDEAARLLGCPRGTVAVRLQRARQRLHDRLTRRGLTLSAAALTTALSAGAAQAAVPPALIETTLGAATLGPAAASPAVAALMKGVLADMGSTKLQLVAVLLAVLTVGTAGGLYGARLVGPDKAPPKPGEAANVDKDDLYSVISESDGKVLYVGVAYRAGERRPEGKDLEALLRAGKVYRLKHYFLAVELEPGEKVPAEEQLTEPRDGRKYRRWKLGDLLTPSRLKVLREVKLFRRLEAGDRVQEGDLVAQVNPLLAQDELLVRLAKLEAAQAEMLASEKTRDEAERRWIRDKAVRARGAGLISEDDLKASELAFQRYKEEVRAKQALIVAAGAEVQRAATILQMYDLRSPVDGVVVRVLKKPGDAVRSLETVLRIRAAPRP